VICYLRLCYLPFCSLCCCQAEIEHFVNPDDKRHPKFKNVAPLQPLLYSRAMQMGEPQHRANTFACSLSICCHKQFLAQWLRCRVWPWSGEVEQRICDGTNAVQQRMPVAAARNTMVACSLCSSFAT
jgi:hypothetical protein